MRNGSLTILTVLFIASCKSAPNPHDNTHRCDDESREALTSPAHFSNGSASADMASRILVEIMGAQRWHHAVLDNAVLLYRRQHGQWPRDLTDLKPFVYDPDRYASVTIAPNADGTATVSYTTTRPSSQPLIGPANLSSSFTVRAKPPHSATPSTTQPLSESQSGGPQ